MQLRVKTPSLVTSFGTFREGELITVSKDEAVGFLKGGLAESVKSSEPERATSRQTDKAELAVASRRS